MKDIIKTCGCGLTFREPKEAQGHCPACVTRARSEQRNEVVRAEGEETITAAGNSEGAKKGWEVRVGEKVHLGFGGHGGAGFIGKLSKIEGDEAHIQNEEGRTFKGPVSHLSEIQASDTASTDIVHCRASSAAGPVLAAGKDWKAGVPVEIMWMPSGIHTICAGFRKGSIELTVQCSEETAQAVQASLNEWRNDRPKQEPFGCIEHQEREASFRIGASCGFKWGNDGVYLAAEPTTLGAQNVNGKIHRSWSPSFTTDADYASATERDGVLMFPEGARGSRSNPASITGVDFCVGTLTNKPAFREMSPVKAKDNKDADYNRTNGGNQATNEELAISFRNDVPDYTEAELLVYCNRIRKGGSHMEAVTEARATRNAKSKASEKPTLESIFAKTHKATETANSIAESHGVVKLTAADVYEKFSVKAGGTSDGVKKGWQHRNRFSEKAESNGIKMNLIGGWQDLAAYYHGDDGNAWKYQNGSFANMGDVSDFRKNFSSRHRGQLDEESTKASDATPDSILERIYARAGASR